jgi:hypothetical protein
MKRLTLVITFVLVTLGQAQAQENRGSAKYMLPFCQTWLKVAAERDLEVRGSMLKTEQPMRLTTEMCAGLVVGVAETLRYQTAFWSIRMLGGGPRAALQN